MKEGGETAANAELDKVKKDLEKAEKEVIACRDIKG